MAGPYSQDLRDRVIDAVMQGDMSRRGAAERFGVSESVAIKWVERFERTGLRTGGKMGGYKPLKLEPHREFLEACHAEKPDVTLQALCDRLLAEREVKADTSLMSRFLRRLGLTPKKRRSSPASRIVRTSSATGSDGASIKSTSILRGSSSSTKPGPSRT
jgi:transposase